MRTLITSFSIFFAAALASAELKLPAVIGDNMILQQGRPNTIWGWADPEEKITVSCGDQEVAATAAKSGLWTAKLKPLSAGLEPIPFSIADSREKRELKNVKVGEVWLCSGQSNMQWSLNQSDNGPEEAKGADFPHIHLFQIPLVSKRERQQDVNASWQACGAENAGNFSAVAYYFGRHLQEELGVPVGLIQSAWGGSRIEPWIPTEAFAWFAELGPIFNQIQEATPGTAWNRIALERYVEAVKEWTGAADKALAEEQVLPAIPAPPQPLAENNASPTVLYNAMIHPIVPFGLRGAIWYQGESNSAEGMAYWHKTKALIHGWRKVFQEPELAFHFVQLAPYKYNRDDHVLAEFWEVQTACLQFPNTGMAVINDIANIGDIHPRNKKDVGHRLALQALAKQYGRDDLVYSGPLYTSHEVKDQSIVVSFDHAPNGLKTRDGGEVSHFEIAGEDGKFVPARAEIEGSAVVVSSEDVADPAHVRFAWSQVAEPNLMNAEGLPASAFRTNPVEP